jgi:hypothetical protein
MYLRNYTTNNNSRAFDSTLKRYSCIYFIKKLLVTLNRPSYRKKHYFIVKNNAIFVSKQIKYQHGTNYYKQNHSRCVLIICAIFYTL